MVASGFTGVGHNAATAIIPGRRRSGDERVQNRRPGVHGGVFAGSPPAFRRPVVAAVAVSTATATAATAVIAADTTASGRRGGAGRRVQHQMGATTGRRSAGHTRVVTMGRPPAPQPAGTAAAAVHWVGKERFDESQRQKRVSRV